MQRLSERMKSEIIPALTKELNLKNTMAAPRITCVKVNVGIGSITRNTKDFSDVVNNVANITGQKPIITKARIAISNFKLRKGLPVGIVVSLRGKRMYDFLDRLIHVVLPRVRDFRGLSPRAFDGHGNYSLGLREASVFPEINPDDVLNVHGLQITVVTTAPNDDSGRALLTKVGFPFKKS